MKQVHNIRVRIIDRNRESIDAALAQALQDAAIKVEAVKKTISDDGDKTDPLYVGELWMDRQQPVRKFLAMLLTNLATQRSVVATNASKYLDTNTHCFVRLDKEQFLQGKYVLTDNPQCVHIRMNIAAFPATKENAIRVVSELFAQ
jgi:RNA-binding protein